VDPVRVAADLAGLDPDPAGLDPDPAGLDPDPEDPDLGRTAAVVMPGPTRMSQRIMRPGGWPGGRWDGWTTSASTGSSG
jgi:hypothetical protein